MKAVDPAGGGANTTRVALGDTSDGSLPRHEFWSRPSRVARSLIVLSARPRNIAAAASTPAPGEEAMCSKLTAREASAPNVAVIRRRTELNTKLGLTPIKRALPSRLDGARPRRHSCPDTRCRSDIAMGACENLTRWSLSPGRLAGCAP